jgi:hypothetical protein
LAAGEWIVETGTNDAIVAALEKATACGYNVLERAAVHADLQYAAVEGVLKRIIIAESKNGIFEGIDRNRWGVETLVARHRWIITPHCIWWRVRWWNRIS